MTIIQTLGSWEDSFSSRLPESDGVSVRGTWKEEWRWERVTQARRLSLGRVNTIPLPTIIAKVWRNRFFIIRQMQNLLQYSHIETQYFLQSSSTLYIAPYTFKYSLSLTWEGKHLMWPQTRQHPNHTHSPCIHMSMSGENTDNGYQRRVQGTGYNRKHMINHTH